MPKKQNSKEKILTIRVSQSQYEKICALADIREMNVTEYIRHTAIGNRIKPTVIEQIKESSERVYRAILSLRNQPHMFEA